MPKSARYHIDRAEIIVLPQKVATTVCFIQEKSSGDSSSDNSSWMKQTAVASF